MRDPQGSIDEYNSKIASVRNSLDSFELDLASRPLAQQVRIAGYRVIDVTKMLMLRYARGDSIAAIAAELAESLPKLIETRKFIELKGPETDDLYWSRWNVDGRQRESVAFAALALCTFETSVQLTDWTRLLSHIPEHRSYLFDTLVKSFVPDYKMAKKYKQDKYQAPWIDPVLRALALPAQARADALSAHMKKWCRILRPWGWRPQRDTAAAKDGLFIHFAYEVALAVCAYDIDDSDFAEHPHYPRELVQWYRQHLRQSRDGARPIGTGADIEIKAPALPAKADLAKSKRKAIARWVELVADGDNDAVDSVLEMVGRPRKIEDSEELVAALYENGHAIFADIKDDETLDICAMQLVEARGMGEFDSPAGPPFGPTRCEAILAALNGWVEARGYRLIRLANDGDAWRAVLVQAAFADELRVLSKNLCIRFDTALLI